MTRNRIGALAGGDFPAVVATRPRLAEPTELDAQFGAVDPPGGADPIPAPARREPGRPRGSRPGWVPVVPGQHGAWAFLVVPVLFGFAVAGASAVGWLLLLAWVCAYPVGYYAGRALTARARRGAWTARARRERARALPWLVLTAALGLPLVVGRPWLLLVAGLLAVVWSLGLWVAARWGERSLANDLMLVGQATVAVPVTVAVVAGPHAAAGDLAAPTVQATAVAAAYLAGSVLQVKSLLREAGNVAYRCADIGWHLALALVPALLSAWWLLGTTPALIRALLLRPGLRPAVIGGIEAVVAGMMVLAAQLAL